MIAQNAIFSKWHSLPLAHLQTRMEHVQEHWAHWTKNKWWIIPAYPKSSHAFTFCARASSPSLAIEEDSCPVKGSCDQIFLLLWNELLPLSCLKHVNSHAWNWFLSKNRIIPNTCLRVHWKADCTLWWTAPFDASPPPLCTRCDSASQLQHAPPAVRQRTKTVCD